MDYSKLRESSSNGSAVSVNHKALITRALTKYPVDFALFRELLQNSADAQSKSVTIQFETSSVDMNVSQIHQIPINRLTFTNDGLDFVNEDWNRLREIASGNPNETKIGAFGVGFYSVFELTDEPLVHSGNQIMAFRYHGVQLHYFFTEKAECYQKGTLIDITYRKPGVLPDLVKFIGFLIQSFTLINLNEINVQVKYGNGKVCSLLCLRETKGVPTSLLPPKGYSSRSPRNMLNVAAIQKTAIQISLKYLNASQMPPLTLSQGFFSFGKQLVSSLVTSGNPEEYTEVMYELTKVDATLNVSVSSSYRSQMIETLLKPPPKQAVMSLLTFNGSLPAKSISDQLKAYVIPEDYNDAKIFIGFPTKQSTGIKSHLAINQIIPTMERTAVDMSNQFVKDWNGEMLYMAGVMARCAYENELALCKGQKSDSIDADFIISRFRFSKSAPDAVIAMYIKEGFWKCSKPTLVPTTKGIVLNSLARFPSDDVANLLRMTPVVTNKELGSELNKMGFLQEVSLNEIIDDVGSSPVSIEYCKTLFHWLASKWCNLTEMSQVMLLSALKVEVSPGKVIAFSNINYYHDRSKLPDDEVSSNLNKECLPYDLAGKIGIQELSQVGITPLSLYQWAAYRFDILKNLEVYDKSHRAIATGVLKVSCRAWPRLAFNSRKEMRALFEQVPCIPTQRGLSRPVDAYVKEIKLFPHLATVDPLLELPSSWLKEIGVRESINMTFVLEALNGNQLKWTNEDLVAYLEENTSSLTSSDWNVLQNGRFFSKCGVSTNLFRASELYAPSEELRKLNMPVIQFKEWSEFSNRAKVLFKIGLNKYPKPSQLFKNIEGEAESQAALRYFVKHYEDAHYSAKDIASFKVIPTKAGGVLVTPTECYSDTELVAFGENVLHPRWEPAATRLGIKKRPKMRLLLERVVNTPPKYLTDESQCDMIFSYFARYSGEFNDSDIALCRNISFIPVRTGSCTSSRQEGLRWHKPSNVFLPYSGSESQYEDLMRPLLNTVHPSRSSMPFYILMGISDRPTLVQILEIMLQTPSKVFELLASGNMYEELLVQMNSKWGIISQRPDLIDAMKVSRFLLGVKYNTMPEKDSGEVKKEISLYSVRDLVIVDDILVFNQFKNKIVTAPQVDSLENLYIRLNVPKLSELLKESVKFGREIIDETKRKVLKSRIKERLQLFLDNTSKQLNPNFKQMDLTLVEKIEVNKQLPPHLSITVRTSASLHPFKHNHLLIDPGEKFDWIDVASVLSKLVLLRPDQDSVVVLEIQLSSTLNTLERKGYNVDKIRHRQGLETVDKKIPTLRILEESDKSAFMTDKPNEVAMDNPIGGIPQQNSQLNHNIQSVQRHVERPQQQHPQQAQQDIMQNPPPKLPNNAKKPNSPASKTSVFSSKSGIFNKLVDALSTTPKPSDFTPANVPSQLNEGIRKARQFTDSQIFSPQNVDSPAPVQDTCVSPQKIHQLHYVSTTDTNMRIYATSHNSTPGQDELLLSEALRVLSEIYGYPLTAINLYRDPDVKSIAFNYGGSLFFNSCVVPSTTSILDYYYPVMAHEIAHNLVSSHGAAHSFYSESYIQMTISKFANAFS